MAARCLHTPAKKHGGATLLGGILLADAGLPLAAAVCCGADALSGKVSGVASCFGNTGSTSSRNSQESMITSFVWAKSRSLIPIRDLLTAKAPLYRGLSLEGARDRVRGSG